MRAGAQAGGVSVKAYAGTTGVLLAFDVSASARKGLLGFAIEREGGNRPKQFLSGMLTFPGVPHPAGAPVSTAEAPIQRFRWSDYRVYPDTPYTYVVHPVYGTPDAPAVRDGPSVRASTSSVQRGDHRVLFNRAAAASQAFSREFPEVDTELALAKKEHREPKLPPAALAWLSRGVLEQITGFCARALDATWALDVGIYEYELPEIRAALDAARARGAQVRIVYHAKPGDPQTKINVANVKAWPAGDKRARVTSRIFHDKFIVASRMQADQRVPQAVLCGSTNFTENGVYRQANVVHVAERPELAAQYLVLFETLFAGDDPTTTKHWIDAHDPLSPDAPVVVGFSPRSGLVDLDLFAAEIGGAARDVLFCTAFALHKKILTALLGAPHDTILRLGLQNSRSKITGIHRDRTAEFVATAMLSSGLEGFLKESTAGQKGNILIHTKLVVVDFTSDAPTVISGSHNLSASASGGNDENYLILRGATDVADCYGVELMRLYDHYRFRFQQRSKPKTAPALAVDDSWTDPYFEAGSLQASDRQRFAGSVA